MRKLKLLYVMHVDWNWIKQRPHFLAISLRKRYNTTVFCPRQRADLPGNKAERLEIIRYQWNRGVLKFRPLYAIDRYRIKFKLNKVISNLNPDILWFTHPEFADVAIPDLTKVVYDCMDDNMAFPGKASGWLSVRERNLVRRANVILVSSINLKKVLISRHGNIIREKIHIVHNAFDESTIVDGFHSDSSHLEIGPVRLGYFGTISKWMDFPTMITVLRDMPQLEYHLIGPVEGKITLPSGLKDSFKFYGAVEHERLSNIVKNYDILIMPFRLTPLVESVDPVKLYEYINLGKPIISIYYDELIRFQEFVTFYDSSEAFSLAIKQLIANKFQRKYSSEQRIDFLHRNSWEMRSHQVNAILDSINEVQGCSFP